MRMRIRLGTSPARNKPRTSRHGCERGRRHESAPLLAGPTRRRGGSAGSPGNAVGAASAAYSKVLWGVLIVLLGVLGSLLYVLMRRKTLVGPTSEPAARTAY